MSVFLVLDHMSEQIDNKLEIKFLLNKLK